MKMTYAEIAAHLGMTAAELAERNAKVLDRIASATKTTDSHGNTAKVFRQQAELLRRTYPA